MFPDTFLDPVTHHRILTTLGILLAAFILSRLGQRMALRTFEVQKRQYRASKWLTRTIWIVAIGAIIALWSPSGSTLLTLLTIIGAGLAVALRDVLLSLVGWIRLSLHPPYRQGDRIEINGIRGDVVDIGMLQTVLVEVGEWVHANQSTGRIVHIPNGWIYQHGVKNYTEGFEFLWMEESVTITFASDWRAAKQILLDAATEDTPNVEAEMRRQLKKLTHEYLVQFNVLTPYVYTNWVENGIELTLRTIVPARGLRNLRSTLVEDVLERFQNHEAIEIAYPTIRVTDQPHTGERRLAKLSDAEPVKMPEGGA